MALQLPGMDEQIFPNSEEVQVGMGNVRMGQATVVVALDGTGDTDNIQDGINLLPSTGGVVYIKEGIYNIVTQITINKSNVIISGAGKSTQIKTTATINMFYAIDKSGIVIENIYLYGNYDRFGNRGIYYYDCSNSKIINSWVENCGDGIRLYGAAKAVKNNIIEGNFVTDNWLSGIQVGRNSGTVIIGNQSNNSNTTGIDIFYVDNCIIGNNICTGNGARGIMIDGTVGEPSNKNTIIGNQTFSNDGGISILANCDRNLILGNIAIGNTTAQITDAGTNTHPNGASGTTNLALDDLNTIA